MISALNCALTDVSKHADGSRKSDKDYHIKTNENITLGDSKVMNLDELRDQVDSIDTQLMELIAQRFACTRKIGEYKKHHAKPSVDGGREDYVVKKWCDLADKYQVDTALATRIVRNIIDQAVAEHNAIKDGSQPF